MKRISIFFVLFALFLCSCTTSHDGGEQPDSRAEKPEPLISSDNIDISIKPDIFSYIKENQAILVVVSGIFPDYENSIYSYSESQLSGLGFTILNSQNNDYVINAIKQQMNGFYDGKSFDTLCDIGSWETSNLICLIDIDYMELGHSMTYKNPQNYFTATVSLKIIDVNKNIVQLNINGLGLRNRERIRESKFLNLIIVEIFNNLKNEIFNHQTNGN